MSDNIVNFERRKINEWPLIVYLADFGDGDGCRPLSHLQHPDDTTPKYIRHDVHAVISEKNQRLIEALREIERLGYVEGKSDTWAMAHMRGIATEILSDMPEPSEGER